MVETSGKKNPYSYQRKYSFFLLLCPIAVKCRAIARCHNDHFHKSLLIDTIFRHERMYTQSELYRKYYEFYGREEAERREAVKEKNGVTANLIVLGGLLLAFMISVTRISVKMML